MSLLQLSRTLRHHTNNTLYRSYTSRTGYSNLYRVNQAVNVRKFESSSCSFKDYEIKSKLHNMDNDMSHFSNKTFHFNNAPFYTSTRECSTSTIFNNDSNQSKSMLITFQKRNYCKTSENGGNKNNSKDEKKEEKQSEKQIVDNATTKKPFSDKAITWLKNMPHNFVEELKHYWSGTKLLGLEMWICMGLIRKITKGDSLTRRERRQLMRTSTDLLRLVPFAFFLIIPFMELALPFALKLFPNMLPSTFHSIHKQEEKAKKELSAKIEVAKFLQEALFSHARTLDSKDRAKTFQEFMEDVRSGVPVDNQKILTFASMFEDEFTLDQLSREQLVAMSKYMQLSTFGTDAFLRYQLNRKISQLKKDDKLIESEGLDSLTLSELQQACHARGLKATSRSKQFLKERLREWLDLSLNQNLPGSILILANAFKITGGTLTKDALRDAMYHLPDSLVDDIRIKIAEDEGTLSKDLKLQLLKKEEKQIKEDKQEGQLTDEQIKFNELQDWIGKDKDIAQSSVSFSASQLKQITQAVADLASKSSIEKEKKQLHELKSLLEKRKSEMIELEHREEEEKQFSHYDEKSAVIMDPFDPSSPEQLQLTEEMIKEEEEREAKLRQEEEEKRKKKEKVIKIGDRLADYVDTLQGSAEKIAQKDIQEVLGLDKNRDGYVDLDELREATKSYKEQLPTELVDHVLQKLDGDNDNKITVQDFQALAERFLEDDSRVESKKNDDSTNGNKSTKEN